MSYKNIYLLYVVRLVASLSFIGGILVPFYTEWAGMEESIIPLIQLWFMVWAALLEVPTGAVADYISRKVSIVSGLLLVGVGFIVYIVRPELVFFLLGELIIAIGVALISGADESLMYDSLLQMGEQEKATKISSRSGTFGMFGLLLGAPIGSLIAANYNYPLVFILTGVTSLLAMIIALFLKEPKVHEKEIVEGIGYFHTLTTGLQILWKHTNVKQLGFDLAIVHALSATIIWMNQIALTAVLVPIAWFGFISSSGILTEIVVANLIDPFERRWGTLRVARWTTVWSAVGLLMVGLGVLLNNQWVVLVGIMPPFSILIGRKSMMRAQVNHHISSGQRATVLSAIEVVRKGMTGLTYIVMSIGLVWSPSIPLLVFGLLLVLVSVFSPIYRGKK